MYSTCTPHMHTYTKCTLHVCHMCNQCTPHVHIMYIHFIYTTHIPHVHHMYNFFQCILHTTWTPYEQQMYTTCTPPIHHMYNFLHNMLTKCTCKLHILMYFCMSFTYIIAQFVWNLRGQININ